MTREEHISNLELIGCDGWTVTTEMKESLEWAISELKKNKGEPIECARTLKKHCFKTKNCRECFMWDECEYQLSAPCDWDLPESEEEEE